MRPLTRDPSGNAKLALGVTIMIVFFNAMVKSLINHITDASVESLISSDLR